MSSNQSKKIAKLILVFFWCAISTYTMPSAFAAKQSLECACNPGACACSHDCHEKEHSEKDSLPKINSANCQSTRNAIEANLNFDVYPPLACAQNLTKSLSTNVFLKNILTPPTTFLDPPFKPPRAS